MTSAEAKAEGYAEGLAGKPSYIAPVGLHHRAWMSGWIDGYIEHENRKRNVK